MLLKKLFGNKRIVGLAGEKSSGKTNNLMAIIKDFRKYNKTTKIYFYGLDGVTTTWLKKQGNCFEVSSINQLTNKDGCIFILDEVQRLKLNSRQHKDLVDKFVDFIDHSNNYAILSSPNLREFNSILGSKIQRWALKTIGFSNLVNGSQLKDVVNNYSGRYKMINDIIIPKEKLLIYNEDEELTLELEYIKEIDKKKDQVDVFAIEKKGK